MFLSRSGLAPGSAYETGHGQLLLVALQAQCILGLLEKLSGSSAVGLMTIKTSTIVGGRLVLPHERPFHFGVAFGADFVLACRPTYATVILVRVMARGTFHLSIAYRMMERS